MYDAVLQYSEIAKRHSRIIDDLRLKPKEYLLATMHRPYNTDNPENLCSIISAFHEIGKPVVFPVHPRTRRKIAEMDGAVSTKNNMKMLDPVGYLDMLTLEENAEMILTDSGGMQKEAYLFGVPCVTLRPETEWIETLQTGWNVVVGADRERIVNATTSFRPPEQRPNLFGDGRTGERIVQFFSAL